MRSGSRGLVVAVAIGMSFSVAAASERQVPAAAAREGEAPLGCGNQPPPILSPANGATVSGQVTISAPLLEGPCTIGATVVFRVLNAQGHLVRTGCDNDLPAHIMWDTTAVKNGSYTIAAHRACNCQACPAFSQIGVGVANPD